ncbi:MAG: hypothetical protein HQK94_17775 [Nitrospirae bacterium]|nr:hypothetical protein [Nitrospirota bacterium]
MKTFILKIYQKNEDAETAIVGIMKDTANGNEWNFRNYNELMAILEMM